MKPITIFTPTFNRAYILHKLYESLTRQIVKDFIWLVVDDGSTDNTKELVDEWKKQNNIEIKFIYQENGGKARAHNTGVKACETELFMCVDSDDYLLDDAIENILGKWNSWQEKDSIAGIIAYTGKSDTETISAKFPDKQTTTVTALYDGGFFGDAKMIHKADILKNFLFPEIEGEKFVTENYVYAQVDTDYEMLLLPKIVVIAEYLEDGYSKSQAKLFIKNPKGYSLYYNLKVKLSKGLKNKFKYSVAFVAANRAGKIKGFKTANSKIMYIISFIPGIMLHMKKKNQN